MSDSRSEFIGWCKDEFRFLTEQGFSVVQEGSQYNPYLVVFGRAGLKVGIRGEGYGSIASVFFVTGGGIEVPHQCVAADWEPFLGKRGKKRMKKMPERSQQEQISHAAKTIRADDQDILGGDTQRLEAAAQRLQAMRDRLLKR